jgi:predicted nucleic acid-binding protein
MTKAVSNATPLIYLAKVNKLYLLKTAYAQVIIPEEVKIEVVDKGKILNKNDAYIVEKAISDGWLIVHKTETVSIPIDLDPGETATLSIAKNLGIKEVLIDEPSAREAARLLDLTPRGTLFIILKALQKTQINFEDFLDILNQMLNQGFRLKEEVYIEAVKEAKRITTKPPK